MPPDRFEKEDVETHEKRRQAFLDIAGAHPERCRIVDAQRPVAEIGDYVLGLIEPLLVLKSQAITEQVGAQ